MKNTREIAKRTYDKAVLSGMQNTPMNWHLWKRAIDSYERELNLVVVSVSFNEGYEKGWNEATSEACKEIAKNYQPNKR